MVDVAEREHLNGKKLNLSLGTPEDVVNPAHPWHPNEKIRVGFIPQSNSWVLLEPPNDWCQNFHQLRTCTPEHSVDLEILDSVGLIEHECEGAPGCLVIKLSADNSA